MRDERKKLALPLLLALCVTAQSVPVFAADVQGAKVTKAVMDEAAALRSAEDASDGQGGAAAADGTGKAGIREADGGKETGGTQSPDGGQNPGEAQNPDDPVNPDNPENPDDPANPDNPANPDDPENPDNPQNPDEPSELPVPKKPAGLRTTCQSKTKVLLAWYESDDADRFLVYRKTGSGSYKKLAEVKKARYTDKTIESGKAYRYRIVPVNADGEKGSAAEIAFSCRQAVNIKRQKYTYREMKADMEELAGTYSDYCELLSIGKSVEGREIYDFAIGNPDADRSLLVVSTLHAREYVCSAMLMREIEYYLQNYNRSISGIRPSELLEDMQIHYIVMANPDGVTISQTSYPRWKANSRGVDLNRNFPAKKFYAGGKRGPEGYSGKSALSEPESGAISAHTINLKKNQGLLGVVNYHAMGQIVFGDCKDKRIKGATQKMYRIARSLTGYRDAGGYSSGGKEKPIGGQYREYVMDMLLLPSITIEVGATWAPCSYQEYNSVFQKNKLVVLKIAQAL